MNRRTTRIGVLCAAIGLLLAGCAAAIPQEPVPAGWALDVHQPGEWWTKPLIPRSVVVQRCPPRPGWSSDPDLTKATALPPGIDVNYSNMVDDYHCLIGWSEAPSDVEFAPDEMTTEAGLRRICSSSGLPMDASWRFLGQRATEYVGALAGMDEPDVQAWEFVTAAFIDEHDTVVSCLANYQGEAGAGAWVELSVGADLAAPSGDAACPVLPRDMSRDNDDTVAEYRLRGAGAVRGNDGRALTKAKTLRIGLVGDSVTTSHPVVDGIAIVDAWVKPGAAIPLDWDNPPAVEGEILGPDGAVLATCRS
nr:hypothetical protein [Propionicimonas sp.]